MPVMSAILGRGPTRPCVAWTSSETNTVRPNPLGARARNGRQGTASPATNPPPKDSASPEGRPPGTPRDRGDPSPRTPLGPPGTPRDRGTHPPRPPSPLAGTGGPPPAQGRAPI